MLMSSTVPIAESQDVRDMICEPEEMVVSAPVWVLDHLVKSARVRECVRRALLNNIFSDEI